MTPILTPASDRIIIATDATSDADGAVRVGIALAQRDGVSAELFSVVEPLPLVEPDGAPMPSAEELVAMACDARRHDLLVQRDRTHPAMIDWPAMIQVGPRADTIVEHAQVRDASLLVLGLGAHGVAARLARRETALRVIRSARTPVLAVPHDAWGVPHSVLAALDFTESSEVAARDALDLLAGTGRLYLAHVTPRIPMPQADSRPWGEPSSDDPLLRLAEIAERLNAPAGVQVDLVSLHGEPAHELVAFAEQQKIDLIATGAHGRSFAERLVLGSVSTKVIRTARSWVLVAPAQRVSAPTVDERFQPTAQPIG
jgi:nucleotide-binding universal stress UspA family protein